MRVYNYQAGIRLIYYRKYNIRVITFDKFNVVSYFYKYEGEKNRDVKMNGHEGCTIRGKKDIRMFV